MAVKSGARVKHARVVVSEKVAFVKRDFVRKRRAVEQSLKLLVSPHERQHLRIVVPLAYVQRQVNSQQSHPHLLAKDKLQRRQREVRRADLHKLGPLKVQHWGPRFAAEGALLAQ